MSFEILQYSIYLHEAYLIYFYLPILSPHDINGHGSK